MSDSEHTQPLTLGERDLTIADIVAVGREFRPVTLSEKAKQRVELSRAVVEELLQHDVKVYGITTGFASLRDQRIAGADAGQLSTNLIKSHSTGVGAPFDEDIVRGAMLVRAHTLAHGYSGVRVEMLQVLLDMLNTRVYPFVPQKGSVGSSGDLAPLSHLFLIAIGDPEALVYRRQNQDVVAGYVTDARETDFVALRDLPQSALPFTPITLQAKEGLGANNGAVFSAVVTALATYDSQRLLEVEELVAALSFEALQAVPDCLHESIVGARPHPGHKESAARLRTALKDSQLVPEDKAASLNMAHYNCALMKLHHLIAENTDIAQLSELHHIMADTQEALCKNHNDHESCASRFQPLLDQWRLLLGWGAPAKTETLPVGLLEQLATICTQHVAHILRSPADPDVQDNYSFRATPTVLGSARQALNHTLDVISVEINSVTDNPIILLDDILAKVGARNMSVSVFRDWLSDNWQTAVGFVKSAANFHGEPIGVAADYLALAMAEAGNISERRLAVLLDSDHSKGLPSYLIWEPGLNSGLMLTQYTAASLVTENKTLATPASVDSIPTGESCEDHNSMSTLASRKLAQIVGNVKAIVALETLAAYQAVQFRKPMRLGERTARFETHISAQIEDTLFRASDVANATEMKDALKHIGLSGATLDSIHPCIIRDISIRPLIQEFLALIDSPEVIALAGSLT